MAFANRGSAVKEAKNNREKRLNKSDIIGEILNKELGKTLEKVVKFTLANTNGRTQVKINVKCASYVTNYKFSNFIT